MNVRARKKIQDRKKKEKKRSFNFTFKKTCFFNINIRNKLMIGTLWLVSDEVCIHIQYFFGVVKQKKIKSSRKYVVWTYFKFWPMKNYKPMRVWLWLVYKFTENYCRSRLFSEFIQTQKRYPTSLDKVRILTWKLLVISSKKSSCELNSLRTYSLQNISYLSLRL